MTLRLQTLSSIYTMKIPKTDIEAILKSIDGRPAEAAFPANLKDAALHQVVRDLRLIELSCTVDESVEPPMTVPMFLIFHMHMRLSDRFKPKSQLEMTQERLQHWMQRYMYYAEREIVSRLLGVPNKHDSNAFLTELTESL